MLERHELHHSPISVASSPAPPEPMLGTRDRPMLVEESPAPHYIMVEDSPAPHFIVVEESLVRMSGVKNRPCLVVESPEPTEDRASTTSPVSMSGTKDRPSLVDDSLAMPKVNNLCCRGGNLVEGGSATLPILLVWPPTTTSPTEAPQLPDWGGGSRGCNGIGACLCFPSENPITYGGSLVITIYCSGRVPAAPAAAEYCWSRSPSAVTPPLSGGLHRASARNPAPDSAILWWGFRGGGHSSSGGGASTCCCAPHTPVSPCQRALWSLRGRGHCWGERWWVISSSWRGESIFSTFWEPHSYTGGGRPTAHLWLSPVCGAL